MSHWETQGSLVSYDLTAGTVKKATYDNKDMKPNHSLSVVSIQYHHFIYM
jgi:hypothetical protein